MQVYNYYVHAAAVDAGERGIGMNEFGCQSMALPLKRVLMRRPGDSLHAADPGQWNYGPTFDAARAVEQHLAFTGLVEKSGAELILSNISPEIYQVFAITNLNKLFKIKDSEADALAVL
jgi:arginine deiminase